MYFDYKDVDRANKERCPYWTGVKQHGSRMSFSITDKTADEIANKYAGSNPYSDGTTVCIFEDGAIIMMTMHYDYYHEDWVEEEDLEFLGKGKDLIVEAINACLKYAPVADYDKLRLKSVDDVIEYLKKGNF